MPKRNRTRTFIGGPQGDDAKLVMKVPTIKEINADTKVVKDMQKDNAEGAEIASQKMLVNHVVSWNWVDDDEVLIPLPKDRSDIFGNLTTEEAEFLGECYKNKTPVQVANEKK